MEEQIAQLLSIWLNSKSIDQLPVANSVDSAAKFIFYNNTTSRVETITKTKLTSSIKISASIMGFVSTSGDTTTNEEIINHINQVGFQINEGQLKILEVIVLKNNVNTKQRYYMPANEVGQYGNSASNPVSFAGIYLFSQDSVDQANIESTVIDLGDIGSDSIADYINANNSSEWNLLPNNIYIFSSIESGIKKEYFYIGSLPNFLGNGNNVVASGDFKLIESVVWYFIEGSDVKKGNGNIDLTTLQDGDRVRNKDITNNGFPLHIPIADYDASLDNGDKQSEISYVVPQLLTN